MMPKDLVFGTATLILSAAYYAVAARIPETQLADAIGPQGLPRAYAILVAVLSLVMIAGSVARGRTRVPARARESDSKLAAPPHASRFRLARAMVMLGIGVAYLVVVPWLGYLLSLALLIGATIYYQNGVLDRKAVLVALAGASLCWLLFVVLMRISQPPGLWPSLL